MRTLTTTASTTFADLDEYDLVVVGAGPVGENVADRAAQGGLSVLIVESELVGGECSYWACMPSKALLRSPAALHAAQHVAGAREAVTAALDADAVLARRDELAAHWDDAGQVRWLESAGIALARGHGRLDGERRVSITDASGAVRVVTARHAVAICTGTSAALPPIDGLLDARPWTSREITSTESVPPRLGILGGGVVGTEMATAFAALGSEVTIVSRSGLLGGLEPFAGELVAERLRESGVRVLTDTTPNRVERHDDGTVLLRLSQGDDVVVDELVVATGRRPNSDDLGLESVGLESGSWLEVDDTMLVSTPEVEGSPWLYAVGDVNHRALLTHQGKYQARAAGDVIAARASGASIDDTAWGAHVATADHAAVPQVAFTAPEVASVGLTAHHAHERGLVTRVVDVELGKLAAASVHSEGYSGRARLVIDDERDIVIGATFVGDDVAELLHAATIAVVGEVPLARLWHAVPSYPTLSEAWLRLLEADGRQSAHSHQRAAR